MKAPPMKAQPMTPARVLFICVGNACRSQMAEAFANRYGADVLLATSAGLAPAPQIPEVTRQVMRELGIELTGQCPKPLHEVGAGSIDVAVNLSGHSLPAQSLPTPRQWAVRDPIGKDVSIHRQVRDEIERLVMHLVLELRQARARPKPTAH